MSHISFGQQCQGARYGPSQLNLHFERKPEKIARLFEIMKSTYTIQLLFRAETLLVIIFYRSYRILVVSLGCHCEISWHAYTELSIEKSLK